MTVQLTPERMNKVKLACDKLLKEDQCTIQNLEKVIGLIISSFQGVEYGPLHHRSLEYDKTQALVASRVNFSPLCTLSEKSKLDLQWWLCNVASSYNHISHGNPDIVLQADASCQGWGGVRHEQRTGGRWAKEEASHHIKYLELLAIKSLGATCSNCHIQVQCDNTTPIGYVNNMGGSKS